MIVQLKRYLYVKAMSAIDRVFLVAINKRFRCFLKLVPQKDKYVRRVPFLGPNETTKTKINI